MTKRYSSSHAPLSARYKLAFPDFANLRSIIKKWSQHCSAPPAIPEVLGNITSAIVRPVFPIYTCIGVKTLTLAYRELPVLLRSSSIGTLIAYLDLLYHSSRAPSPPIGPINWHSHVALLQLPQGDPTKLPDLVPSSTRRYYGFLF